jgi:hypothetical protein
VTRAVGGPGQRDLVISAPAAIAISRPGPGELQSVRFGWDSGWTQFLVPRNSTITDLSGLDGLSWAYSDVGSLSSYILPLGIMEIAGVSVNPVNKVTHQGAVRAVYNGDTGFATTYFSPPQTPAFDWEPGDPPDVPDSVDSTCGWEGKGLFCGDSDEWRVPDARAHNALVDLPDIVQQVRILAI